MNEFKLHQHVSDLVKFLGSAEKTTEKFSCEDFVDILKKSRNQYSATKTSSSTNLKKLLESCPSPDNLNQRYDEMIMKHTREVDPLVSFMAKVQADDNVRNLLQKDVPKLNGNVTTREKLNGHLNGNVSLRGFQEVQKQAKSAVTNKREDSLKKKVDINVGVPSGTYTLPNWVRERCHLSWDFESEAEPTSMSGPIKALPPNVQESRLIDDVLFCLVGIDGDYIRSKELLSLESGRDFLLDDSANISLKLLVKNMLPMFSYYSTIIRFVEAKMHYGEGLVNHALSAAMRTFLRDYFVLVSQLESQHLQHKLTLQKLWFYLQPSMTTMETIAGIAAAALAKDNCYGGNVLSVLHESTASLTGSSKSREICHALTRSATLPYFEILEQWIYKGIISDFYSEFLVEEENDDHSQDFNNGSWEKIYKIRRDQVPTFLAKVADIILRTGNYLNIIRQCGKTVECPNAKPIVYTTRESQYLEYIEPAYRFASKKLLDLLMDEADLKGRLISVKHYFLLDQGDFIVQFMDMAEEELQKNVDDIQFARLESLLELALRTSVVNDDKYKDDLRFELKQCDLLKQLFDILQIASDENCEYRNQKPSDLTGIEAFTFLYDVKWPLSLVMNNKALAYYQILFRHLFYCKHIENLLGRLWALNKRMKSFPRSELCLYAPAFALRQRMLNFIQNLDYYLTLEVIEPHWNDFYRKISMVNNIDEVLYHHNDFLEKCVNDCMLSNPHLLHVLATLMRICVHFSNFLQDVMKSCMDMETSVMVDSMLQSINEHPYTEMSSCPAALEDFQQKVSSFEKKFSEGIVGMLSILHTVNQSQKTSKIINMVYRLDFSRFYEEINVKKFDSQREEY